jgi:hypothetical protein
MNTHRTTLRIAVAAVSLLFLTLAGCNLAGGGGSSSGGTDVVMSGTMTKGSVILNGVRFDDTSAGITADESTITAADLDDGMTVKLKGTVDAGGETGEAELVEVENELKGSIDSIDSSTDSFVVLGQTVFVDSATVFADVADLAGLSTNDPVEVHGMRTSTAIRATRVELLSSAPAEDEVRGIVADKDNPADTFEIAGASGTEFNYDGSTFIDGGSTFANGDLVEVHLNGSDATRIELEDEEDSEFSSADEFEIEGYVSNLSGSSGNYSFTIGTQQVETTAGTEYEGGAETDLADDVRVEVEGPLSGGTLFAEEIEFEDTVRLEGNADSAGSANLFGLTVEITGMTDLDDFSNDVGNIVANEAIRVRGFAAPDGATVIATEIIDRGDAGDVASGDEYVQGIVTSINGTTSFVILGKTIALDGGGVTYELDDDAGTTVSKSEFFAQLKENVTVVKAEGAYSAGTLTATELSLE